MVVTGVGGSVNVFTMLLIGAVVISWILELRSSLMNFKMANSIELSYQAFLPGSAGAPIAFKAY